jgi:ABC-2 type transport system permease protein
MRHILRSAFVIARRDFTSTVFSRAFLFFLIGPLFPVLMVVVFGTIGGMTASDAERPVVAVIASDADFRALAAVVVSHLHLDHVLDLLALRSIRRR